MSLVDVVNFNADASCLSTKKWFSSIENGNDSLFCSWLRLYCELKKKVVLGLTGTTIADLAAWNPEALDIIRGNLDIFQLIVRPFSHDIALLRTEVGFRANLALGLETLRKEFGDYASWFLPPEFMLTNEQITVLAQEGIQGTFINPARFSSEISNRIPRNPYFVEGVFGGRLQCIPFVGELTAEYLNAIHLYDGRRWTDAVVSHNGRTVYLWRDGESPFLLPDAIARERLWLESEGPAVERSHLGETVLDCLQNEDLHSDCYHSYPVHTFLPWMREFRMLAFVNRVIKLEAALRIDRRDQLTAWLLATGSDILSAIEKKSPVVKIKINRSDESSSPFTIMRSERGFEGEEYLLLAERCQRQDALPLDLLSPSTQQHHRRYLARTDYLRALIVDASII